MRVLYKFGMEIFWTMFWVFLVLIIGFGLLSFLSNRFSGNLVGTGATWVEQHSQPGM